MTFAQETETYPEEHNIPKLRRGVNTPKLSLSGDGLNLQVVQGITDVLHYLKLAFGGWVSVRQGGVVVLYGADYLL
ncbi:hypothetical protein ES704_02746 [subsurface metagenome]|jgi:hypothetical protein